METNNNNGQDEVKKNNISSSNNNIKDKINNMSINSIDNIKNGSQRNGFANGNGSLSSYLYHRHHHLKLILVINLVRFMIKSILKKCISVVWKVKKDKETPSIHPRRLHV